MRVDIWSDIVCPWCYIGKRRFETGLAAFAHRDRVEVVYHSFELDPEHPKGRTVRALDLLTSKHGMSHAQAEAAEAQVAATAAAEGLPFVSDRPHGNTFDVHRLLHLAKDRGLQRETLALVNRALWAEQRPVFDPGSLVPPAVEAGLDANEVRRVLAGDDYAQAVRADERQARALGITGVPFYVLDGRYGISGAQSAEVFTRGLEQAWAESGQGPSTASG
ncbi:MAG TPA: DsbA family oxidoreductase [Actinomadura sp.]|jgi:predicted DsbA family dithiol-disulfide isomerase|nr:DsbA family oxidoreductase [Actinomadura sp.]